MALLDSPYVRIPWRIVAGIFRVLYRLARWIVYLFWSHPPKKAPAPAAPAKRPLLSKSVRWDLLEKGQAGQPKTPAGSEAAQQSSTAVRAPKATGQMPPLTPRPASQTPTPAKPFSDEARRESVRLTMNVRSRPTAASTGARMAHSPTSSSFRSSAMGSGGGAAKPGPGVFNRGQVVSVMLPDQNTTVEARIANVGASEIMFSLEPKDAMEIVLQKDQKVVLLFAPKEGVLHVFDAQVSGLKSKHSTWFSVSYESMKLRGKRLQNRITLNTPIRYCTVTDREQMDRVNASSSHCDISAPATGLLSEIASDWFSLLTEAPLAVGWCILQVPGAKAAIIENLNLSGEVIGVTPNSDPLTKRSWPHCATLRLLTTSDALSDLIAGFGQA